MANLDLTEEIFFYNNVEPLELNKDFVPNIGSWWLYSDSNYLTRIIFSGKCLYLLRFHYLISGLVCIIAGVLQQVCAIWQLSGRNRSRLPSTWSKGFWVWPDDQLWVFRANFHAQFQEGRRWPWWCLLWEPSVWSCSYPGRRRKTQSPRIAPKTLLW